MNLKKNDTTTRSERSVSRNLSDEYSKSKNPFSSKTESIGRKTRLQSVLQYVKYKGRKPRKNILELSSDQPTCTESTLLETKTDDAQREDLSSNLNKTLATPKVKATSPIEIVVGENDDRIFDDDIVPAIDSNFNQKTKSRARREAQARTLSSRTPQLPFSIKESVRKKKTLKMRRTIAVEVHKSFDGVPQSMPRKSPSAERNYQKGSPLTESPPLPPPPPPIISSSPSENFVAQSEDFDEEEVINSRYFADCIICFLTPCLPCIIRNKTCLNFFARVASEQ